MYFFKTFIWQNIAVSFQSLTDVCQLRRASPLIQQSDRRLLQEKPSIYLAHAQALLYHWFRVVGLIKQERIVQERFTILNLDWILAEVT